MEPLIFKTNIQSKRHLLEVEEVFDMHPSIASWNVDTEDIDKVLRIEQAQVLAVDEVIRLVSLLGLKCEVLEW